MDYEDYRDYSDELLFSLMNNLGENEGKEINEDIASLSTFYANLRSLRFVFTDNELSFPAHFDKEVDLNFADYFDEIEDMFIDIKVKGRYHPYRIQVVRQDDIYHIEKDGIHSAPIYILLNLYKPEKHKSDILLGFAVFKETFPNIYIIPDFTSACKRCNFSRIPREAIYESRYAGDIKGRVDFCYGKVGKLRRGYCEVAPYRPDVICKLIAYVWDMYAHRHTLARKNSKRKEHYKTHTVSTAVNVPKSDGSYYQTVVPLHEYYEREKRAYKGGHHASPVEHTRSGHIRVYRNPDGSIRKVSEVRGSIVNRGKGKPIYSVNAPKKKNDS